MSIPRTIDDARWHLLDSFGVAHGHLRGLEDRLSADFVVDDYGYAQFSDLGDIRLRAVVSDQVLRTAHGIGDNLLAACLHRDHLESQLGGGRPMPKGPDAVGALRLNTEIDIALAGFFGALASALDTLAGVAIGVCRLPRSITKADGRDLEALPAKLHQAGTPTQQQRWSELALRFEAKTTQPPNGWFAWLMEMRNVLTHRARQERTFLQQTVERGSPQLAVVTDTPADVADTWVFDLHLRQRPALPDMQEFTRPGALQTLWMAERAVDTIAALLMLVGELIESVAEQLLQVWNESAGNPMAFPAPAGKYAWQLADEPGPEFHGITGTISTFRPAGGLAHGQLTARLELAEKVLRETRPGQRGATGA
jgi:hypothetical protein